MSRTIFILIFAASLMSCSPAEEPTGPTAEEDLTAIAEARDALLAAVFGDDVPGILDGLTEDHFTMPPGGSILPNSDALRQWHQGRIDGFSLEGEHIVENVALDGDLAVERWSSRSSLTSREDGEVVEDALKGIWVWKRQEDGAWKLLWSVWNSDLPVGIDWTEGEGA